MTYLKVPRTIPLQMKLYLNPIKKSQTNYINRQEDKISRELIKQQNKMKTKG
jgi:hypothetical protein